MTEKAVIAQELTHYYNEHPAVDHLNFTVERSTIFGLLGPNGAGKSTTVKMLTTLLYPTSGTAAIFGYDIRSEPQCVRQNIGYVPQSLSSDGDLTGYENLSLSAKLYGLDRSSRKRRIAEVLAFMGLQQVADTLVNQYSGGMIRRLEIAQALLHQPHVLFLDEPTSGLDPVARSTLWKHLLEWRKSYGTTIFLTTHDMQEAEILCDIVAFMHLGHIVAQNSPAHFKQEMGQESTLADAFIHYTQGIKETGDYSHASQMRRVLSRRK